MSSHEKITKRQPSPTTQETNNQDVPSSLQRAKDHAQITASTSMSIVHVALLELLLESSEAQQSRFYRMNLGLVISALVLQIIAGFVTLYIAFLRHYYRKYKDNAAYDCCSIVFPCSCRRTVSEQFDINGILRNDGNARNEETQNGNLDRKQKCTCCPWQCVNKHFIYDVYDIRDIQTELTKKQLESELKTANYEKRLKCINDEIAHMESIRTGEARNKIIELEQQRTMLALEYQEMAVVI